MGPGVAGASARTTRDGRPGGANILRKLDLPSRTAAAAYAVRTGLLEDADA
jgi:hypothetical protein